MRLAVCAICIVSVLTPLSVSGQKIKQLPSAGPTDPFRLESGSSFAASAPGAKGTVSTAASRERTSILKDISEAEAIIGKNYFDRSKTESSGLTKAALGSLLHSLDPHSNFYDQTEWKDLLDEQRSGYAGIGISLSSFVRNGRTETYVMSTFDGTPAQRAGLRFGDRIVAVGGVSFSGKTIDDIRDQIRGPVGTLAHITLERASTNKLETIDVRRGTVAQPSIPDSYIIRPGVGYIDLSEGFNYTTNDEITAALHDLHQKGMQSLILDLRGNGGGIVDQAVKVAEKFLPSGSLIVSQRGRSSVDDREWRSANISPETMPLVILVDENTASASEIVAGALQDNDRALIIGEKTFGKGLVQNVIDLPSKTGLTLTAARYYTPSGRSIQREYSDVSRYEYFTHHRPDAAVDKPFFAARTITNRTVTGGDGIAPDNLVSQQDMNSVQLRLLDPIFFFTRELVNGRVDGVDSRFASDPKALGSNVLVSFKDFYEKSGYSPVSGTLQREQDFIRLRVSHYVATASLGEVVSRRVLTQNDPQVGAAINDLPKAGQLAQLAARMRRSHK